jgi:hypothetical protein
MQSLPRCCLILFLAMFHGKSRECTEVSIASPELLRYCKGASSSQKEEAHGICHVQNVLLILSSSNSSNSLLLATFSCAYYRCINLP